jgi:hypothetical protein
VEVSGCAGSSDCASEDGGFAGSEVGIDGAIDSEELVIFATCA